MIFFFLPAAISLQSSVGRHLMNYLLSEVMFTSLYIYWDSLLLFFFFFFFPVASFFLSPCLRKSNSDSKSKACCCAFFKKKGNMTVKRAVTNSLISKHLRWYNRDIYEIVFSFF